MSPFSGGGGDVMVVVVLALLDELSDRREVDGCSSSSLLGVRGDMVDARTAWRFMGSRSGVAGVEGPFPSRRLRYLRGKKMFGRFWLAMRFGGIDRWSFARAVVKPKMFDLDKGLNELNLTLTNTE